MKTIGLIGGMSWESTTCYYTAINQMIKNELGGLHSAKIVLYSVDFSEIEQLQRKGRWEDAGNILSNAARSVALAGADFILLCTNTMHTVAEAIESTVSIPLIHIADATAEKLVTDKIQRVGLLGTTFTMEQDFYKKRISKKYGIDVLIPPAHHRKKIHDIIYSELCMGHINESSRQHYIDIIQELYEQGAQAVILGCTEIALLIQQKHTPVPLYDTTQIHAQQAVKLSITETTV